MIISLHFLIQIHFRARHMMLMIVDDQIHPLIGAATSSVGVILTQLNNYSEARQCFREARTQFRRIFKRLVEKEKTTQEIISKQLAQKRRGTISQRRRGTISLSVKDEEELSVFFTI